MKTVYRTPERLRKNATRFYWKNHKKLIEKAKVYRKNNREEINRRKRIAWHQAENKPDNLLKNRIRNQQRREEKVNLFGGKCVICGESNIRFLHIDKIDGGKHPTGLPYLKEHKKDFQVLCANHHYEKTYYQLSQGRKIGRTQIAP